MDNRLISLNAAIDAVHKNYDTILDFRSDGETVANSIEDILSELPSATDTNVGGTDTISRSAAIEAMRKAKDKSEAHRMLLQLPSAQPVEDARAMCGECDAWNQYKSRKPCGDAVSRFEVLRLIDYSSHDLNDAVDNRYMQNEIKQLPSVTPKQRWIPCSERLPEPGEYYLVTRQYFGWNCTEYREIDIAKYDFDGWHKATTVLAWCELLKPWEGGQP